MTAEEALKYGLIDGIMDKRKYIVFAHIPILHHGKWYTQPTLTDEIAEEYLKENPKDIIKFKKYHQFIN